MKKALFIIEDMNNSGSPLTALHFIETIKQNCETTLLVLCVNSKDDTARLTSFSKICNKIIIAKYPHLLSKRFKLNYWYYIKKINVDIDAIFLENDYDYVYLNRHYIAGFLAKHIKKNYQSQVIFNSLGKVYSPSRFLFLKTLYEKSIRLLCVNSDKIIAISKQCFPICGSKYDSKLLIIHDYPEISIKTDKKIFSPKNQIILGQIGYYSRTKNQLFSLSILKAIIDRGFNAKLIFMGFKIDAKYWTQIKTYISNNSLSKHVEFRESNYDKCKFFCEIDVVLMPSISEGYPLTILEAFCRKTPIISSFAVSAESNLGHLKRIDLCNKDQWVDYLTKQTYKNTEINNDLSTSFHATFANQVVDCFKLLK